MVEHIKQNLFFIIGIILIGGVSVYWFLGRGVEENVEDDTGVIKQPSQFAAVRAEILGTIAILKQIRLDITVLDEPAFKSLTEAPEPPDKPTVVGKRNPFVP